jgi:hypothetical protein
MKGHQPHYLKVANVSSNLSHHMALDFGPTNNKSDITLDVFNYNTQVEDKEYWLQHG